MRKGFQTSGFLYHPPTQKILLQQITNGASPSWSLFGGAGLDKESAEVTFQRVIYNLLHIKLPLATIYPVYTYFYASTHKTHAIVYAEVKKMPRFSFSKKVTCACFTQKQILKLELSQQTRHDLVIGQRVIDAKARKLPAS